MTDHLHDRVVAAVGAHYLVEGEIGRGGMAVVYRAVDLRLNRPVAIKVLPPELAFNPDVRTRFLREAQTSAQLTHPNIVPIYTVDETEGLVYFVMALVNGESVGALLAREPRRPVEQVRRILSEVADALDYAHRGGVVHRDIKPDNILIDRASGRAMVTDFGIARAVAAESRLTVTGVAVGTPAYMSPEQALGERELDGRSDIYSLGIVGYQMLAGETPFRATNTPAMLVKHVSEQPRPVRDRRPDAPPALAAAVDRALAKKPEDRWSTAAEFKDALAAKRESMIPQVEHQALDDRGYMPKPAAQSTDRRDLPYPPVPLPLPHLPQLPPPKPAPPGVFLPQMPPPGLSRRDQKLWWREQKQLSRERWRAERDRMRQASASDDTWRLERRVLKFRKHLAGTVVIIPTLLVINAASGGEPWFLFPSAFLGLNLFLRAGSLWADGISPIAALKSKTMDKLRSLRASSTPANPAAPVDPAAGLVAAEVLAGSHGEAVRRAAADRELMRDIIRKLGPVEKELLPDVMPTIDALTERVSALAATLHRLDADVSGASLGQLDQRIAALQTETTGHDRERRLALLQRQRASLHDLLERRRALVNQLESASLALQNLKFDLLKLRSAGVGNALDDVTSATREARALSRDISHLLEAADDLRKI